MAEIAHQGRVIETREGLIVIQPAIAPGGSHPTETTHDVGAHDAAPGDYVFIYDDGQVEVRGRGKPLPDNVTEAAVPMGSLETDHP